MIIGITGSFGTGKTTVARLFKSFGAEVIDADRISHHLLNANKIIYSKLIRYFGRIILSKGKIDRRKLGHLVFTNLTNLKFLSTIMHPQIIKIIKRRVNRKKNKLIVIDAPLLVEAGLGELVDVLIVVKATKYNQLIRTRNKFHLSDREIIKRISTQLSLDNKIKLADFVGDNNGTITETRKQVKRIWERIKS